MTLCPVVLLVPLMLPGAHWQTPQPAAAELARALQNKYEKVRDFSADFVHVYEGGILRKRITERGTLLVKKPGKMRWTYTSPEQKLFVSDGVKIYSYVPQDRQVIISTVPAGDRASSPILFLAGRGNIERDFRISHADMPDRPADTYALKMVPTERQQDYDWLVLVVDRQSLRVRMLVTNDAQGGQSTFTFSNLRENVGPSDKEFSFKIPRGVDVVTDGRRGH
jgi:outer membrane lipoprotein carrier protein